MIAEEFVKKAYKHHIPVKSIGSSTEFSYLSVHTFNNGYTKVRVLEEAKEGSVSYEFVDVPPRSFFMEFKNYINADHIRIPVLK